QQHHHHHAPQQQQRQQQRQQQYQQQHRVTLVTTERIYDVTIIDCTNVIKFPATSLQEWNEFKNAPTLSMTIRNASAYLLIYDVTDEDSFRFVRGMHEQICRHSGSRDVPIFVVGNKIDLL
ncbi:hypothetical protein HELRODRAFT_124790, partial [Helobdella robusta]|uniref:Small monomeric GTPase n=1 Tax=Helobdella robusta TaxID=6412 RepID=T1EH27_HELRO